MSSDALTRQRPTAWVVCGPSGVGKSTVGLRLAQRLHCSFVEGDDFHSAANVAKMRSGTALTDQDRLPWLRRLRREVIEHYVRERHESVVLACSALRRAYRDVLRGGAAPQATPRVFFVLLSTDAAVLSARLAQRQGHFMPGSLLPSQLATLEPLDPQTEHDGVVIDVTHGTQDVVAKLMRHLTQLTAAL